MILPPSAGVIGWPVAHSKSPRIHRFWLGKLGIDGDYGRFPVHPDALAAAIAALPALGLRGVNVTVPHKTAVMPLLDEIDAQAAAVGAVNTVVVTGNRLTGYNTDVAGIAGPVADVDLAGRTIVLVGAGGAARALLSVAKARDAGHVAILNRSADKAAALLGEFGLSGSIHPLDAPLPPAALLFNATSLGMTGQPPLALDLAPLPADAVVFDAVYAPLDTALLLAARARGLRTIDGLSMLIGQAATAFEYFYGAPAPRQFDAELRAELTA
jgi:shikimate dehydrogenase